MGRDLKKTIILDNCAENFQFQQDNGIFIRTWGGEQKDDSLYEIAALLRRNRERKINKFNLDNRKMLIIFFVIKKSQRKKYLM